MGSTVVDTEYMSRTSSWRFSTTFYFTFFTMALLAGREIMNSKVLGSIVAFIPRNKREKAKHIMLKDL